MKYYRLTILFLVFISCNKENKLVKLFGPVFGTTYNIQYYSADAIDYSKEIDSLFTAINYSMSNYQTNSLISKINRNEEILVDEHFVKVFKTSKKVFNETKGIFDPTIGNLVNYWNFGAKNNENAIKPSQIDSLMHFVGFDKIRLLNTKITKPSESYIDFNAVAKGYALDVIGGFLEKKGISNYLVEIGGEVLVKGKNLNKNALWRVGIQNPNFEGKNSYNKAIGLNNVAMATSGTYRKFRIDEKGNRYAHIINTKTGYPTKTNILSVSVIANSCVEADAYATAFQAMGINMVKSFIENRADLRVYFIYESQDKEVATLALNGFPLN